MAVKVGHEVRRRRLEKGRSQEDFADDCGVHRTYMGSVERGEKVISIEMAKRIAAGLGIEMSGFFAAIEE